MKKLLFVLFASLCLLSSCSKDDEEKSKGKLVVLKVGLSYDVAEYANIDPFLPSKNDSVLYTKMNGKKIYIYGGDVYIDSIYTNDSIVTVKATEFYMGGATELDIINFEFSLNIFNKRATDKEILGQNSDLNTYNINFYNRILKISPIFDNYKETKTIKVKDLE